MENPIGLPNNTLHIIKIGTLLILTTAFLLFIQDGYGWRLALSGLTALFIGIVFFRSQFGFSYTWRIAITHRQTEGIQAQMLWILLTVIPFYLLTTVGDQPIATANVRLLTAAIAVGALIFGIGMQLGGACTTGAIVGVAQGNSIPLLSIIGFIVGTLLASSHIAYWQALPALPAFSFYQSWGLTGAIIMMIITVAVIVLCRYLPALSTLSTLPLPAKPKDRLSLITAAIVLSILTIILLALSGQPWGVINGMTIIGGKAMMMTGFEDVEFWDNWARFNAGSDVLYDDTFSHIQIVTTASMLIGVALAAIYSSKFHLKPPTLKLGLLSSAGGVLMGYGAQLSFGCNIGSYMSALSSGSMHGWLWVAFAFIGTAIGIKARKLFRMD